MLLGTEADLTVDVTSVKDQGEGRLRVVVLTPSGARSDAMVVNNHDGTYQCVFMPDEEGISFKS